MSYKTINQNPLKEVLFLFCFFMKESGVFEWWIANKVIGRKTCGKILLKTTFNIRSRGGAHEQIVPEIYPRVFSPNHFL